IASTIARAVSCGAGLAAGTGAATRLTATCGPPLYADRALLYPGHPAPHPWQHQNQQGRTAEREPDDEHELAGHRGQVGRIEITGDAAGQQVTKRQADEEDAQALADEARRAQPSWGGKPARAQRQFAPGVQ